MSTPVNWTSSLSSFASQVASTYAPITMSGFSGIDFSAVVGALMQQASMPLNGLQTQQSSLEAQNSSYTTLASDLGALQTAAGTLGAADSLSGTGVSNTDAGGVAVSTSSATPQGTYTVVVNSLAQAQVTSSSSTYTDTNTTTVASGGSLSIGGVTVSVSGNTTLQGLADAINNTTGIQVTASVVESSPGQYSLELTGNQTGSANAFTVTNNLTGGAGITFGASSQSATDASVTVDGVTITSSTNTISSAIPGATLTLEQANATATITVSGDTSSAKTLVQNFVTAYNNLESFVQSQQQAYQNGDPGSIANGGLLGGLMSTLTSQLSGSGGTNGTYQYLAQVGIGFDSSGKLTFNSSTFDSAASSASLSDIQNLFSGPDGQSGLFSAITTTINDYVGAGGLVSTQQSQISTDLQSLDQQIANVQSQLFTQQQSLQQEYTAANTTISTLNGEGSTLTAFSTQYQLN